MNWERGAGFRIVGAVDRKFVPLSGKCAFLTLAVPGQRGEVKHECKTFDLLVIEEIRALGQGQVVQAIGTPEREKLTNKAKQPVMVDGREVWVPMFKINALTVEGGSARAKQEAAADDKPAEDYFR
ncbi:MAG TPA: hypothetical protein VMS92_22940 [Mycobacterium sp.]|nr:hypothetical protein [Mycobacterium sp.]